MKQTVILLILLMALPGRGATYYVDAHADAGGNGTTTATTGANCAWDSIHDATGAAAGSTVLFQCGDTFRTTTDPAFPNINVIWGSYGTGTQPNLRLSQIASGAWNSEGGGVYSLVVAGITDKNSCYENDAPLVEVANESSLTPSGTYYVKVATTTLYVRCYADADPSARIIEYPTANELDLSAGMTLQDIWVSHSSGEAGTVRSYQRNGCTVQRCTIGPSSAGGGVLWYQADNCTITQSVIRDIWNGIPYTGVGGSGSGFRLTSADNCSMTRCLIQDCYQGASWASDCANAIIQSNLVVRSKTNGINYETGATGTCTIANNTIYHSPNATWDAGHGISVRSNGATVSNNCIYCDYSGVGTNVHAFWLGLNITVSGNNNCWYVAQNGYVSLIWGVAKATLALHRTALDAAGLTAFDTAATGVDPLFVSTATPDFHLLRDSPCRDVGTNLGATYDDDYSGYDQDKYGLGWEIGAYVYRPLFVFKE